METVSGEPADGAYPLAIGEKGHLFEHKEVTGNEKNPLHERVLVATKTALTLVHYLDNHPRLKASGLKPLFHYNLDVLKDSLGLRDTWDPDMGVVEEDTYFTSGNDSWSRLDLPKLTGVIDRSDPDKTKYDTFSSIGYTVPRHSRTLFSRKIQKILS